MLNGCGLGLFDYSKIWGLDCLGGRYHKVVCTLVEYLRSFRFDFSYTNSRKEPFLSNTEFDSFNRVLVIPTLHLDSIIGYGVVLLKYLEFST